MNHTSASNIVDDFYFFKHILFPILASTCTQVADAKYRCFGDSLCLKTAENDDSEKFPSIVNT